ncbi:uncharacterized protein LOC102566162 isoform X3 [Alligator mississippiensis]|uniref:uncharacterized protein LOC102566162 isoform X3 n=1 Tax=Alligator mississippiensis TaxID=8496 RepID=UPI002877636D|nr:uncharacterized protein LOC102566162 isoform X3 [Alligator mississippiensis]
MGSPTREALRQVLGELRHEELWALKQGLEETPLQEGSEPLPRERLWGAEPAALADLLLNRCGERGSLRVAVRALRTMGRGDLAERLMDTPGAGANFVDYHREQLIKQVSSLICIRNLLYKKALDREQYESILAETSDKGRMRKLFELVSSWDMWRKDQLYQALKATNSCVIEELEGKLGILQVAPSGEEEEEEEKEEDPGTRYKNMLQKGEHFVDRHQEQLIQQVSSVDTVLGQLCECALSTEQYQSIMVAKTTRDRMQKLYELVPSWDTHYKDLFYKVLKETNQDLIEHLEGEHTVEKYRKMLIAKTRKVDRVLGLLSVAVLDIEQYQSIMAEKTDRGRMEKLFDLVPQWKNTRYKDELLWAIKATQFLNCSDITVHPAELFIDWNREELIQRVSSMDTVLDLLYQDGLPTEQYESIMAEKTDQERLCRLYQLVPNWDIWSKVRLYYTLKATNRFFTEELKGSCTIRQWPKVPTSRIKVLSKKHFVDQHKEQLIQQVSSVDKVLGLLSIDVLSPDEYQFIMAEGTDRERMQKLYKMVLRWNTVSKDQLYWALKKTNQNLITELQGTSKPSELSGSSLSQDTLVAGGKHIVEEYQWKLIASTHAVEKVVALLSADVLNPEQYWSIMASRSDQEKMYKLYELVPLWDTRHKDELFWAVKAAGPFLRRRCDLSELLDLYPWEGNEDQTREFFLDWNREELIQRVSSVDTVMDLLYQDVLDPAQYHSIMAEGTDQERMRRLYALVPRWDTRSKDRLYWALKATNRFLFPDLKESTFSLSWLYSSTASASGKHFIDEYQEQLLHRVSSVDDVLHLLSRQGLDPAQLQSIQAERNNQERLRKLFKLVPTWDTEQQHRLYSIFWDTNPFLMEDLQAFPEGRFEHFIRRHQEELIQRVSLLAGALGLLSMDVLHPEQYQSIMAEGSDQDRMRKLYELVPTWGTMGKDQLYWALKQTNQDLITELLGSWTGSSHSSILNPQDEMMFLLPLFLKGSSVSQGSEQRTSVLETFHSASLVSSPLSGLIHPDEWDSPAGTSWLPCPHISPGDKSKGEEAHVETWGQESCNLCAGEEEATPEEIKPEAMQGAAGDLETYRVHLSHSGLFCCSETKLWFKVRAEVTITYKYNSWRQCLADVDQQRWMVAGPLFSIQVETPGAVAAIYLPHFLCLGGGQIDRTQVQIAHFIDGGMTLEKPTRVGSSHAMLENPSFSVFGVLWNWLLSKMVPRIHALVLLYWAQIAPQTTLNLYLIPKDTSIVQGIDKCEKEHSSIKLHKPSQTRKPLHIGSHYAVSSPFGLEITPEWSSDVKRQEADRNICRKPWMSCRRMI